MSRIWETVNIAMSPEGIALVTLNRPTKMNSLSMQMIIDLYDAIEYLRTYNDHLPPQLTSSTSSLSSPPSSSSSSSPQQQPPLRVVILTGIGPHFCAGLDIINVMKDKSNQHKLLYPYNPLNRTFSSYNFATPATNNTTHINTQLSSPSSSSSSSPYMPSSSSSSQSPLPSYKLPTSTHNIVQHIAVGWQLIPVPVICALSGYCYGGGLQIAMGCDIRIGTPDTKMSILEIKWGIIPDMGITATAQRVVPQDILRLLSYTGDIISGSDDLLRYRLITDIAHGNSNSSSSSSTSNTNNNNNNAITNRFFIDAMISMVERQQSTENNKSTNNNNQPQQKQQYTLTHSQIKAINIAQQMITRSPDALMRMKMMYPLTDPALAPLVLETLHGTYMSQVGQSKSSSLSSSSSSTLPSSSSSNSISPQTLDILSYMIKQPSCITTTNLEEIFQRQILQDNTYNQQQATISNIKKVKPQYIYAKL